MRKIFAITAVAALLFISPDARGQAPGEPNVPSKVTLTLEQRHVIKEIVKDLKIDHAPTDVEISMGAVVPKTVNLQPMPSEVSAKVPQIKSHLFFVKDGQVVIVDPKENKIVEVID